MQNPRQFKDGDQSTKFAGAIPEEAGAWEVGVFFTIDSMETNSIDLEQDDIVCDQKNQGKGMKIIS